MRAAAFDELHYFFKACYWAWREQKMEVVGHYDEFMERIGVSVAIVKEGFYQDFSISGDSEDDAALPALCGYEVTGAWCGSVLGC
jgi:hypothetical protein